MAPRRDRKRRTTAARETRRAPASNAPTRPSPPLPATGLARHAALLAVLAVLVLVALVRLRIADLPLERDEGEYAYAGQLILQGIPPYQLAYNMKFPGTYYAYAAILALFGQTAWGIHLGLLVVNAATALLLFFLGRRLVGAFAAAVGTAAFAVLALDRWILGVLAHATHFVVLPALAGLLLLHRGLHSRRVGELAAAGVLLGISVLMKQHAILFLALGIGLAVWHDLRQPTRDVAGTALRSGLLLAGALLPFAILCGVLAAQGVLGRFWFWTFQYAKEYVSVVSAADIWPTFTNALGIITRAHLPVWLLGGAGLVALWATRWALEARVFLSGWLVAAFLAVCPGFYFRPHYFIVMLPVVGLLVGVAVASVDRRLAGLVSPAMARMVALAVVLVAVGMYVATEQRYLFSMAPRDISRSIYGANPFIEAVDIARHIRADTTPEDRIAVVGSEPEIYFYANRKSATGYLYMYPLMEPQRYASHMQEEMIREIEAVHPKYLVFIGVSTSWLRQATSHARVFQWIERYAAACYQWTGVADIYSLRTTAMLWDAGVPGYRPRSSNLIHTYRRKSAEPCRTTP